MFRLLVTALVVIAVTGCVYPLGMSQAEWEGLTPEQRLEARQEQARLDEAKRERRAREAAQRRRIEAEIEVARLRDVRYIYEHGRFGDVVECRVGDGIADFRPGWHLFDPSFFRLARGEIRLVEVKRGGANDWAEFWAEYTPDGERLWLCDRKPSSSYRDCQSVAVTFNAFSEEASFALDIPHKIKNGRMTCAFIPVGDTKTIIVR